MTTCTTIRTCPKRSTCPGCAWPGATSSSRAGWRRLRSLPRRRGSGRSRPRPRSRHRRPRAVRDPIASGAVNAAKQYKGLTLGRINEAGPQALDDKNFSGPLWEKLTGIKTTVTEAPFAEIRTKVIAEHLAKSGALDTIEMSPAWLPDFADQGVIIPIDALIRKYRAASTLTDLHPLYRALGRYKGKTWGFFDDGDVWSLYYRKDIFNNPKLKAAYKAKYKRDLRVPRGWDEFNQVAQFITDQMAPTTYGTGMGRALGNPGNQFYFFQQFRANGGRFFNPRTMRAEIANAIGIKTMNQILLQNKASPPGVEKLDFVSGWGLWLQGKTAMIMAWPPTGRISENYSQRDKAFSFLPKSTIVGKVGYARVPGLNGEHAGSFIKAVMATSENQDAAYLFNQWANSPSISLQRVMLPYTLRDPYRISHYKSPQLPQAVAERGRVPSDAQRVGERRRARPHDERRGRLRQCARPGDDRDLRRQVREGRSRGGRRRVEPDHRQARGGEAACLVRQLPHVPGRDEQEHRQEARSGRQDLTGGRRGDTRRRQARGGGRRPPPHGWTATSGGSSSRRRSRSSLR